MDRVKMINEHIQNTVPIGVASMSDDGTIHLHLRVECDGILGDSFLSYPSDDKDYQQILEHIGGLKPGEYKPVPPWQNEGKAPRTEGVVDERPTSPSTNHVNRT